MSANLDILKREADKRISQLQYIRQKFGRLRRDDLLVFSVSDHVAEVDKDIERVRSNVKVAEEVYDGCGLLDDDKTRQFCSMLRAIVVYREVVYELRKLLDCAFGANVNYMYLNPEGRYDAEAELSYLTLHPDLVPDYLRRQRAYIHSFQNANYVEIDETVPFGL